MPAVAAGVNMGNLESPMWYGYTKPDGKCPSESVLKAPSKGFIRDNGIKWGLGHSGPPAAAKTFLKNAGFHFTTPHIRQQKILIFNPDISFQFGLKPQIAASHFVYREGRRIINSKKRFPQFSIRKKPLVNHRATRHYVQGVVNEVTE